MKIADLISKLQDAAIEHGYGTEVMMFMEEKDTAIPIEELQIRKVTGEGYRVRLWFVGEKPPESARTIVLL